MRQYMTAQRKKLAEFLQSNSDYLFFAEEISKYLGGEGGMSISAVYRNLDRMVEEGSVHRFVRAETRSFLYQYVGAEPECSHVHLKCVKCGRIFHAEHDECGHEHELILDGGDE